MKICMVTTFYPPYNFGGDGIFIERLVHALLEDGHEVHVVHDLDAYALCSGKQPKPIETDSSEKNFHRHILGDGRGSGDLILTHQLGRPVAKDAALKSLLTQEKFDVIHFHNVSLLGGPGVLAYGNAVKLCTLHDHWFVCAMHVLWKYDREACTERSCLSCTVAGKRPPQLWRYNGAVSRAAKHVDAFIAPSEFARESHIRNGFPAPIKVLPHFIPDAFTENDGNGTAEADSRQYFMFAGRLEKLKGAQVLIEQFQSFKKADLLIAGTGEYEADLRQMASGADNIRFAGKVDQPALARLYRDAVAVIVPSLCFETFGLVALEAFAQATPAIVHDLGALSEIARGGGAVKYSTADELRAAMNDLVDHPESRERLAREAKANLLSNYTQQRHMSGYYAMISELTSARRTQEVR